MPGRPNGNRGRWMTGSIAIEQGRCGYRIEALRANVDEPEAVWLR